MKQEFINPCMKINKNKSFFIKKKHKQKPNKNQQLNTSCTIYIVFILSSTISNQSRNGTGFYRQRCRHIGFTDDFVTKRNDK
jgi:hypothetical protein